MTTKSKSAHEKSSSIRKWSARRVLSDWQMPECLPDVRMDVEPYVDKLAEIGVQSLLFTAQSAHGNCLFPSKIGYTNKVMRGDIFGDICRRAKLRGLEFIAYYNQTLSFRLAEDHPEWQQVDCFGKRVRFENCYPMFCMNCDPYRERVFAHMAEITRRYDIDGFMLDINYFPRNGCFCRWCREKFKKRYGYLLDFKRMNLLRHWMDIQEFLRDSRREFTLESAARCRVIKPDLTFTWNHSGDIRMSEIELDSHADYAGEECTSSVFGKWMAASGKPFEVWMPESIGDWGDWTLNTPDTIKARCALALAHGGAVNINHVAPPCGDYGGRIAPAVYELLGSAMKWVGRRERLCLGKRRVPVIGVLHSVANTWLVRAFSGLCSYAQQSPSGSPKPQDLDWPEVGASNSISAAGMLRDIHAPVDFLFHENAMDDIASYEAVLLPNVGFVSDDLADRLRDYVRRGGKLIATYNTSLLNAGAEVMENFKLADLFGADFRKWSDYSLAYLDDFDPALVRGLPQMPLQVRIADYQRKSHSRVIYCSLRPGARALARFVEPVLEPDWEKGHHIYHNQSPPGKLTRHASVIFNRFGKGACIFLPFPLLQSYEKNNIWLQPLMKNLLGILGVPRRCQITANPAVELVLKEDDHGWLLHLLHMPQLPGMPFINGAAPSGPVACRLAPPWPVAGVENAVSRKPLAFSRHAKGVRFQVDSVNLHEIIRIRRKSK